MSERQPVGLVVPLGPNPASLTEVVWRLWQEGLDADPVFVVLQSEHARDYLDLEILGSGGAWAALRAACPGALPESKLQIVMASREPESKAFGEAVFSALRAAQEARERVVLTLSGGRWRGSTALSSTVFQLLARPADLLVDVRLGLRAAEGATGFYFPDQPLQELRGRRGQHEQAFVARDVAVHLEPLELPRLRPFVGEGALGSFAEARRAGLAGLEAAAPPSLSLDLFEGALHVDGRPLALSHTYFPYVAWVVVAAWRGEAVQPSDLAAFRGFLREVVEAAPSVGHFLSRRRARSMAAKLLDEPLEDLGEEPLKGQVHDARKALLRAVAQAGVRRGGLLEPVFEHRLLHEAGSPYKAVFHRLRLPAEHIRLVGPVRLSRRHANVGVSGVG